MNSLLESVVVKLVLRCFGYLLKHKQMSAALGLLMVMQALFTGIPILLVQRYADPALSLAEAGNMELFYWFVFSIASALVVRQYLNYRRRLLARKLCSLVVADIRMQAITKYLRMSLAFFDRGGGGDAVVRVSGDASAVWSLAMSLFRLIQQPIGLAAVAAVIISRNPVLGAVGFIFLPLAAIPVLILARRLRGYARRGRESMAEIAQTVIQIFSGMRVIIGYGREEEESSHVSEKIEKLFELRMSAARTSAVSRACVQLINNIGLVLVILVGAHLLGRGSVDRGEILAVLMGIMMLRGRMQSVIDSFNGINESFPKAERIFEILDMDIDMTDIPDAVDIDGVRESVAFEDVCFGYGRDAVLDRVSFTVPVGSTCAIVGPSGAGKSSLANLVPRFYDPVSGRVTIDGRDVRQIKMASLRKQIGIVTQDPFLFLTSIAENIRYGRLDCTDEEMIEAARAANIHDEILSFPDGYQTIVGERGLALSGGQRQRVAIARAILRGAPILVLDEATSSLDSVAERQVQAALDRLMSGRTTLIVAHRLSTVSSADQIVVLVKGRIEATGHHEELLEKSSTYRQLWDAQQHG